MDKDEYDMRVSVQKTLREVVEKISDYCGSISTPEGHCHAHSCDACDIHKMSKAIDKIADEVLTEKDKPHCPTCGKLLT